MITLLISIAALILGYFVYGRFVEKVFGPDKNRLTPAHSKADGIDYVLLPSWKVFMIQFLNIAGTDPSSVPFSAPVSDLRAICG